MTKKIKYILLFMTIFLCFNSFCFAAGASGGGGSMGSRGEIISQEDCIEIIARLKARSKAFCYEETKKMWDTINPYTMGTLLFNKLNTYGDLEVDDIILIPSIRCYAEYISDISSASEISPAGHYFQNNANNRKMIITNKIYINIIINKTKNSHLYITPISTNYTDIQTSVNFYQINFRNDNSSSSDYDYTYIIANTNENEPTTYTMGGTQQNKYGFWSVVNVANEEYINYGYKFDGYIEEKQGYYTTYRLPIFNVTKGTSKNTYTIHRLASYERLMTNQPYVTPVKWNIASELYSNCYFTGISNINLNANEFFYMNNVESGFYKQEDFDYISNIGDFGNYPEKNESGELIGEPTNPNVPGGTSGDSSSSGDSNIPGSIDGNDNGSSGENGSIEDAFKVNEEDFSSLLEQNLDLSQYSSILAINSMFINELQRVVSLKNDFTISWQAVNYLDTPLIPEGEINFSQMCRENEQLGRLKTWLSIILKIQLITSLSIMIWNYITEVVGLKEMKEPTMQITNSYDENGNLTRTYSGKDTDGNRYSIKRKIGKKGE